MYYLCCDRAGVVIQGQARVDTSFVQTMIEFNAGLQSKIDFVTDVNYEKGVKMCIQMVRPQLLYQFCPYPEMRVSKMSNLLLVDQTNKFN